MGDTRGGIDAELERVDGEIGRRLADLSGFVAGRGDPSTADKKAETICRELDGLFTQRGALRRRRGELPSGAGNAAAE